jgi:5-formyltetrahydrofolate cyclo-ligase
MNKESIRELFIAKRKFLKRSEKESIDESLLSLFKVFLQSKNIELYIIHIYLPIVRMNEVNTWKILDYLFENHTNFKVYTSVVEADHLLHKEITKETVYGVDKWGIPIPNVKEQTIIKDPLMVIVPLLACDLNGYRVGYGKGFYDKFLNSCKPGSFFIGLSQFEPLESFNQDPWDVPLDVIISPSKIYDIKKT